MLPNGRMSRMADRLSISGGNESTIANQDICCNAGSDNVNNNRYLTGGDINENIYEHRLIDNTNNNTTYIAEITTTITNSKRQKVCKQYNVSIIYSPDFCSSVQLEMINSWRNIILYSYMYVYDILETKTLS